MCWHRAVGARRVFRMVVHNLLNQCDLKREKDSRFNLRSLCSGAHLHLFPSLFQILRCVRSTMHLRALFVGGWSDGPLCALRQEAHRAGIEVVSVDIPTPPVGVRWCCNAWLLAFPILLVALRWAWGALGGIGMATAPLWAGRLALLVAAGLVFRACVHRVVRVALQQSADAILDANSNATSSDPDVVPTVLVGFSWGGAVVAFMLGRGLWRPSRALLLAPTVSAAAACAGQALPVFETPSGSGHRLVRAVYGRHDGFCSAAEREHMAAACGADVHVVPDDHPLCRRDSGALIRELFFELLQS